jgi:hypothetical protein
MTTIITRLYPDTAAAETVAAALVARGHRPGNIEIVAAGGDTAARLKAARVGAQSAAAYAPHIERGAALVVYRAPFAPLGTARDGIRTVDGFAALDAGVADENAYIRESADVGIAGKVMTDHPLFMTRKGSIGPGRTIAGGRATTSSRPRDSAIRGGAFISTKLLPFPLLKRKREARSAMQGGGFMTGMFGPMVLRDWRVSDILVFPMLLRR